MRDIYTRSGPTINHYNNYLFFFSSILVVFFHFHFVPFLFSYDSFLFIRPAKKNSVAVVFFGLNFLLYFHQFSWNSSALSSGASQCRRIGFFIFFLLSWAVTQRFWISNLFSFIMLCVCDLCSALGFIFWLERIKFIVNALR